MRASLLGLLASVVVVFGCGRSQPQTVVIVQGAPQATAMNTNVRVRVRLNCEAICRTVERACRQACNPQAWSPNMQSIRDACERDCDFSRFVCVGDCSNG